MPLDPPNLRLKMIAPGTYQLFHRATDKLMGSVKRVGNDWEADVFTYVGGVPEQIREMGLFASRRDGSAKVWDARDPFTDAPYGESGSL